MMRLKIYSVVFIVLHINMLYAGSMVWKKLDNIEMYSSEAYNLKKNVDVLELRSYYPKSDEFSYRPDIGIYVKPENKIDKKLLVSFKKAQPNFSTKSNIAYPSDALGKTNRAFVLYANGKISCINEISDVVKILGDIDTPTEAQLILWLHAKGRSSLPKTLRNAKVTEVSITSEKYRKVSQGYEVLSKYNIYANKPGTYISTQAFVSGVLYHQVITTKSLISKKGKIIYFRQISKSKIKEEESTLISLESAIE